MIQDKNMAMEFPEKLLTFTAIEEIQPGTHFRYTYEKYQEHGECKCIYAICTGRDGADIWCKGYKWTYNP